MKLGKYVAMGLGPKWTDTSMGPWAWGQNGIGAKISLSNHCTIYCATHFFSKYVIRGIIRVISGSHQINEIV